MVGYRVTVLYFYGAYTWENKKQVLTQKWVVENVSYEEQYGRPVEAGGTSF